MDILDIDEIEDEFGIFEEKMQDDVTNILKQWKIGNSKKDAIFDSRTFTRPKGSVIRNSIDVSQVKASPFQENQNGMCMKIGGFVSNIQKSCLNDISPPNSISSSINFESETMSNSLITSADFSNISFFKTSLMDSNIDLAFKNNLKHYNIIDHETRLKYEKNIPRDIYNNDSTMKSSVSKDDEQHDITGKFEAEENLNKLTDSTKENSPNCHESDNNGSSFHNNTQIMSNTFKKRNSSVFNDNNGQTNELADQTIDINKTFLRKAKNEHQMNRTFNQVASNTSLNNTSRQQQIQHLNETQILKATEKNQTFIDAASSSPHENTLDKIIENHLPSDKNNLNNFETATSTPHKNTENEIVNNINFSPITPYNSSFKYRKQSKEEVLSSDENLFDVSEEIHKDNHLSFNNYEQLVENENLDIDNLSDLSDKIENSKENAMKKSLETIKKRFSHKYDKSNILNEKTHVQKISSTFPENGRLLSRRSRLNDDLVLNQNIVNELNQNNYSPNQTQNNLENDISSSKILNKIENFIENDTVQSKESLKENLEEKENIDEEKDINTKKKNESKRSRNDDRFKTIKINKPFSEQFKEEILDINETDCSVPAVFARIDKNAKQSNFENEPLKFDNKFNQKSIHSTNEKLFPGSLKNMKYERITKNDNLGKAISASHLENASKAEPISNFKFAVPAPVKQIKSPMGTKAKSFHNLASNNFGFKKSTSTSAKPQENSSLATVVGNGSSKSNNTRYNDPLSMKNIPTLRPTNIQKRTGLMRPSSGYFSRGVSCENNALQTTYIKEDKNTKYDGSCSNLNFESKPELNSTTIIKPISKLAKPTESKLPTNIKRSGLPRPSISYRK